MFLMSNNIDGPADAILQIFKDCKTDLFVTWRERFIMNIGNNNPNVVDEGPSSAQSSMSSPIVCDFFLKKITWFQ